MSQPQSNWFETFFEGIAVEYWAELGESNSTAREVDYLVKAIDAKRGAIILDVACGVGRHAIEVANREYQVQAVDISRESIFAAQEAARTAGVRVDFRQMDMRAVTGVFDGAYCWGNSFGYLPHLETRRFLAALSRAMKPGAVFVLQQNAVAESLFPHFKKEASYRVGEIDFKIRNSYEPGGSVLETEFSFTKDGRTETKTGWQTIYTSGEICRLLAEARLRVERLDRSMDGAPYEFGAEQLIVVARKFA